MIKYNYVIERDEGIETVKYTPNNFPKKLDDIVLIEGKNSTGKSTLLNIIALSLFGRFDNNLNSALKEKLDWLQKLDHQKITFDLTIDNKLLDEKIIAVKDNPETIEWKLFLEKNGKRSIIDANRFKKKYNLIYDIPDNPINRLDELVYEIRVIQNSYTSKIKAFRAHIGDIINDINNSRNDEQIEKIDSTNKQLVFDKEDFEEENKDLKRISNKLKKYYWSKKYQDLKIQHDILYEDLKVIRKKNKIKTSETENTGKEYREVECERLRLLGELQLCRIQILKSFGYLDVPKKKIYLIDDWKSIEFNDSFSDANYELVLSYLIQSVEYINELKDSIDKNILEELNIYQQLLNVLNHFKSSEVIIPGIEKTIPQIIVPINKKISEYRKIDDTFKRISECNQNLIKCETMLKTLCEDLIPKSKRLMSKKITGVIKKPSKGASNYEISKKEDELTEIKQKLYSIKSKLDALNINLKNVPHIISGFQIDDDTKIFTSSRLNDIEKTMMANMHKVTSNDNEIGKIKRKIAYNYGIFEEQKKKKVHPLVDKKQVLNTIWDITETLESKMDKKFSDYITDIIDKNIKKNEMSDDFRNYYDQVCIFLANKIMYVKHGKNNYEVKLIDYLDGKIITSDKRKLLFKDFGTGQSQSAYLRGKLEVNDERKIIALFDEVAAMDDETLDDVIEKMRDLYNRKKLLCGIIVQKAEKSNVTSLI